MLKSAPSLLTQPSLTGVAGGTASDNNEPEFSPSPAMAEITVNFLVRMAFLTGEGKDQVMKELNAKTLKLLKTRDDDLENCARKVYVYRQTIGVGRTSRTDSSSALGTVGRLPTGLPEVTKLKDLSNRMSIKSRNLSTHACRAVPRKRTKCSQSGRHGDDEEDAHAGKSGCRSKRRRLGAGDQQQSKNKDGDGTMVATRKTATIKSPSRLNPWIRMLNRPPLQRIRVPKANRRRKSRRRRCYLPGENSSFEN